MDIQGFIDSSGVLTTSNYEEAPYTRWGSFNLLESDIRNMHPEKLSPKSVEDPRFANLSLVNTHAWAFSYLHLWCTRPQSIEGDISTKQRLVAIFCKPIAALSDAVMNTAFLPLKLALLVDRVAMTCFTFILRTSLHGPSLSLTWGCSKGQFFTTLGSIIYLVCQPINVIANLFSPHYDLFRRIPGWSYEVYNKDNATETILDQGRVHFLRKYLGWQDVEDTALKATSTNMIPTLDRLSYVIKGDKVLITATWTESSQVGNVVYTYKYSHRNYKE